MIKELKLNRDVVHLCPKLNKQIIVDISQTPVCLSCKFPVYKLAIRSPKYLKIAQFLHFTPLIGFLISVYLFNVDSITALIGGAPWHLAFFFYARYMISEKSSEWKGAVLDESHNWVCRKR